MTPLAGYGLLDVGSPNAYLRSMLARYPSNCAPSAIAMLRGALEPSVRQWGGRYLREISVSGSNAKGTAVGGQTDLDLFISVSHDVAESLRDIYWTLFNRLRDDGWSPQAQNVSVGVKVAGYRVDIVPGRVQLGYQNRHSLYRRKADSWTLTNVAANLRLVKESGRTEEIRLAKIWRAQKGLEFPSMALELAVLEASKGRRLGALADNFWAVLAYFAEDLPTARLLDPTNTANVVSDDLTLAERRAIAQAARGSRAQSTWRGVLR